MARRKNSYNNSELNGRPVYVHTQDFNDFTRHGKIFHAQGSHDIAICTKWSYANSRAERSEWYTVDRGRAVAHENMNDQKNARPNNIKHVRYYRLSKNRWALDACIVDGVMVSCHGYTNWAPKEYR